MSTTTAQRRKPSKPVSEAEGGVIQSSPTSSNAVQLATVKRRRFGTTPWDDVWLNRDCCGLFCALITYGLHSYAGMSGQSMND